VNGDSLAAVVSRPTTSELHTRLYHYRYFFSAPSMLVIMGTDIGETLVAC
jgi:hypothetical protein